ncbi:MAG TPA: hypothetical protein VGM90_08860 [Kofleriaceae bacterium]|jgi:hypothetical protein
MRPWVWLAAGLFCGLASEAVAAPVAKPAFVVGNRTFVAFGSKAAAVRIAWSPVAGAARYRAVWDGDTKATIELPSTTTVLERAEYRAGAHQIQVIAIDDKGNESDAADVSVEVVVIEATSPGFDHSVPTPNPAYAIGSRFRSAGLPCQLDGQTDVGGAIVASQTGSYKLRCGGQPGQPLAEVPIVIVPVHVTADTAPIQIGTRTEVHITVASVAPIGDKLTVTAIGPLDLGQPERVDGGIDVRVTPRMNSGTGILLVHAGDVELGRITLDIVDAPLPAEPELVETRWAAFDVGGFVGSFTVPHDGMGSSLLGKPTDPHDTIANGAIFGARLGFFPTRRLGLEMEVGVVTAAYANEDGIAPILITRPQIAVRAVEDERFGLRLLAGADLMSVLDDRNTSTVSTIGGVHYGAAFTIETRARMSVRLQALHIITAAQDSGYASCFEVGIGITARLGRRDRWD